MRPPMADAPLKDWQELTKLTQGAALVVAGSFVVINLAVDVLYSYLDPRIRYH